MSTTANSNRSLNCILIRIDQLMAARERLSSLRLAPDLEKAAEASLDAEIAEYKSVAWTEYARSHDVG